jgi:hypothetical protein
MRYPHSDGWLYVFRVPPCGDVGHRKIAQSW